MPRTDCSRSPRLAELGAQVQHVRVDGAHAADVAVAPHARQQLLPGEHAADAIGQEAKQLEFVGREAQRLVRAGTPAASRSRARPRRSGPAAASPGRLSRACSWRSRAASSSALTGIRMKSSAPISGSSPETRPTSMHSRMRVATSSGRWRSRRIAWRPISRCSPASTSATSTRPFQLREIVADDLDRVAQGAQHRCGRVLLQLVALRVQRDDEGS